MTVSQIRVLIVEDQILMSEGTRVLLERDASIKVVGQADNSDDALRLAEDLSPDVILLDIRLKSGNGIVVARTLRRRHSPAKVIVLTAYDFEQYIDAFVRAGVDGYLLKDVSGEELISAIHKTHGGQGILAGEVTATVLQRLSGRGRQSDRLPGALTAREIEVLELLAQDCSNNEIARRLKSSTRTVETHVANILGKLAVNTRVDAVRVATENGYVKPQGF